MDLKNLIREFPDFPKPGISFKDITPLLLDKRILSDVVESMASPFRELGIELVTSPEARGFLLGPAVAVALGAGYVPVRKPGRLPGSTLREDYSLEYGMDGLEIHEEQVPAGAKILFLDDVLASGGTCLAATRLIERAGGEVVGYSFLIELSFLNGKRKLTGKNVSTLVLY